MKFVKLKTWLLSLLVPFCLSAQQAKVDKITIEDGLSQGMILQILQDKQGFLWIATKDGLNRFDGYDFVYYKHNPSDTFSISGHIVNALYEDSRGWLWVGTANNGLNLFDRQTGKFLRLMHQADRPNTLGSNSIQTIREDHKGNLLVGTSIGLDRIVIPSTGTTLRTLSTEEISNFEIEAIPLLLNGHPYPTKINTLMVHSKGALLLGTEKGVFIKQVNQTAAIPWHNGTFRCPEGQESCSVQSIIEDDEGNILLGRNNTIYVIKGQQIKKIPLPPTLASYANRLAKGTDGKIYGASSGLFRLRPDAPDATEAIEIIFQEKGLSNIPSIFIDKNGVIWLGTNGYGVVKYNPAAANFNHRLPDHSLRQIFVDQSDRIWVWTNTKLQIFNPTTRQLEPPKGFPDIVPECRWMWQDRKGDYWFHYPIKEKGVRLIHYIPDTGVMKEYGYNRHPYPLANIVEDADGNIWMGSGTSEIMKFNPKAEAFSYYSFTDILAPDQSEAIATVLQPDDHGIMWIGTQFGVIRLDTEQEKGQLFQHEANNPQSLSENYILSILPDPDNENQLWIGTMGGGLNLLEKDQEKFSTLTTKDGLPNDVIYGILPDEKGNLWLSTNRGLSKFNPTNGTFDNYTSFDGLQANEFNTGSYTKAADGRQLFGGVNGFNVFRPSELDENNSPPKVVFTELKINNEAVDFRNSEVLKQPIEMTGELSLPYDQNLLHFKFAALDFTVSSRNQYRYQMVGVDQDHIEAGYTHEVTYANLAPGKYTFRVWGTNRSLQWSDTPAEIKIEITPPWWKTPIAYLCYALAVLATALGIYRFQLNRIRLKNQLAFEHKEAERLAELNRMKSNFFSNITHEFRTPLTLILEPARQLLKRLKNDDYRNNASLIQSNALRMLNLVNQLLDLSKIESGQMRLHWHQGDVIQTAREVFQQFVPLAEKKDISLYWEAPKAGKEYTYDKSKLEQVISNLLSNALKFTPAGGQVLLKLDFVQTSAYEDTETALNLMIKDSGIGIAHDQQEKVFDRFYQIEHGQQLTHNNQTGTGIGLSLVKELTNLMQGQIRLESQSGRGTTFYITWPLHKTNKESAQSATSRELNNSEKSVEEMQYQSMGSVSKEETELPILLIVEDNPDLNSFMQSILQNNFTIYSAADGAEGLRQATKIIPDLIISDVMMPIMDGYQLCHHLKSQEQTAHIPIILLTAKSSFEHKIKGLKTGADAYLTKPFSTEELTIRIDNLIAIRKKLQHKYTNQKGNAQKDLSFPNMLDNEFLKKLTDAIDQHVDDESLSIENLAAMVQMSRSQLHRKLKALTDQSATEFLRNYRLDKAMEMLQQQRGNVTEVAMMVGFSSQPYFSTRFKERFGFSPKEVGISSPS